MSQKLLFFHRSTSYDAIFRTDINLSLMRWPIMEAIRHSLSMDPFVKVNQNSTGIDNILLRTRVSTRPPCLGFTCSL